MPGKNNWVQLTYDGLPQRLSRESFQIDFTGTTNRVISFQQACAESAHEIHDAYGKIHISLSGGCDSECVANSFYNAQIPFTPVIISLGDQNYHDIRFALRWCEKRNIQPVVLEFTLDQWIGELSKTQAKIKNRMWWGLHNVWLADWVKEHNSHLLTGCCDLQLLPEHTLQSDYPELNRNYRGHYVQWECDYAVDQYDPGYHPNGFFVWKPEMILAFLNARDPEWSNEEAKWYVYEVQPRPKYAGCEYAEAESAVAKKYFDRSRKLQKFIGKHDWIIAGTKETLWQKLYAA